MSGTPELLRSHKEDTLDLCVVKALLRRILTQAADLTAVDPSDPVREALVAPDVIARARALCRTAGVQSPGAFRTLLGDGVRLCLDGQLPAGGYAFARRSEVIRRDELAGPAAP